MAHVVICPKCQQTLRSSAALAGAEVVCPACATRFSADQHAPQLSAAAASGRGRAGLLMTLAGGLLILAVAAVGAFVWPGFLVHGRPVSQARTLLAYVPPDSTVIAGAQVGLFRSEPEFQAHWNELKQKIAQLPEIPAEARELLDDADEVVVAGSAALDGPVVFVASTERPYDPAKVKRLAKARTAVQRQGQTFYPTETLIEGRTSFLALPSDKIVVLGLMSQDDFARLLAGVPHSAVHADLKEQLELAQGGLAWVAARFDDVMRGHLEQASAEFGPVLSSLGPELPSILSTVRRSKGAFLAIDFHESKLKLRLGVTCHQGQAADLKSKVELFWKNQATSLFALGHLMGAAIPGLSQVLTEVQQTFAVEQQHSTVIAAVQLQHETLQKLAAAVRKK